MEAPLVRAYLEALPDVAPDERSIQRVRTCLASLQTPDVRYLVATLLGPRSAAVARVAGAILHAAGAPTATLGRSLGDLRLGDVPIDEGLIGKAGTISASAGYQLAYSAPELGELSRREGVVILALTAFAEASQRVALLLDPPVDPSDPVHAPQPDLVVIGPLDGPGLDRALDLVPKGCPLVIAPMPEAARESAEERITKAGMPALVGGRDYAVVGRDGQLEVLVRGEPYVRVDAVPDLSLDEIATGIAAALALGALGIRMREDWVVAGIAALGAVPVGS